MSSSSVAAPVLAWRIGNHAAKDGMQAIIANPTARGRHQPQDHACQRRMNARRVQRHPDTDADYEIKRGASDANPPDASHDSKAQAC
ncbi:hypothetical protein D9M70_535390 [compost metagenome]